MQAETGALPPVSPIAHPADRLLAAIERVGAPVCIGLDPVVDRAPAAVRDASRGSELDVIDRFTIGVLDAVASLVPAVKFQSACFERYGAGGVEVLERLMAAAHERGLEVILDVKRGDIGISASHYAAATLGDDDHAPDRADWVTVNGYLGREGVTPFLDAGGGVFTLVRTSNPSSDELQSRRLEDGRTVSECMADLVAEWSSGTEGASGYGALGAVVGATHPDDIASLRERMPRQLLLVPGYGAQGGGVDGVRSCFHQDGRGAIVTASRSVIYASAATGTWSTAVRDAAQRLADDIGRAVGLR